MNSRQRFLSACACQPLDRPPLWIMRQAGRYLPEYRALKERYRFVEMVRTPELAHEITLQPLRRFPLDAAILFSDILVIPEALGQGYHFKEEGGIAMDYQLQNQTQIEALAPAETVPERLDYVLQTLRTLKQSLAGEKALLGFGGSPWTLASYMVEGGGSVDFERIKGLYYQEGALFGRLMEKITAALIAFFQAQIAAGVDAIQIFDSWGGVIAGRDYEPASLRWIRSIIEALPKGFPVILFSKGASSHLLDQAFCGAQVLGLDWTTDLRSARAQIPSTVAVQGNLDPIVLNLHPEVVVREASTLLESMRGSSGYIFNLGHGITPRARLESVEALVKTVTEFQNL